jgi:hypothetical protein
MNDSLRSSVAELSNHMIKSNREGLMEALSNHKPFHPDAPVSHTEHQPDPIRLDGKISEPVLPYVLQDFRDKAGVGLDKYQTLLRTNNGRDALADAYQEAVDKVMYLKQLLMEQDFEAGVGTQDLQLDADLEQEKALWLLREENQGLVKRLEAALEAARGHSDRSNYWQDRYSVAEERLRDVTGLLRDVALDRADTEEIIGTIMDLHKKYGSE